MNFYSLDGLETNQFTNQIYENFENISPNKSQDIPTNKSNVSDSEYQCSDDYLISGTTFSNQIKNTTLDACKTACKNANSECIGFNFDTSNNVCTLKSNATSLSTSAPLNTLCIKKSSGNKCKISKKINNESAFNELDAIFANTPEQIQENHIKTKITNHFKSHVKLEDMIRNYYNISVNEQNTLVNNLSNMTNVPPNIISENMPKLIYFVNIEDTPNYNLISTVKQFGIAQQKTNPEKHILSTPSQLPIPSESEMNLSTLVTQFSKLTPQQQTQLINTIANYSGVSPDYIKQDIGTIAQAVKTDQTGIAGIYNKIQSLDYNIPILPNTSNISNTSTSNIPYAPIISEQKSPYPMSIPTIEKPQMENKSKSESESINSVKSRLDILKQNNDGIFVDLNCFMNNIEILKNHSENMMIDLSLLLSNVKSCSYVKKNKSNNKNNKNFIDNITSKIEIPTPDTVKLQTIKSTITIPQTELTTQGQLIGIIQEPFNSDTTNTTNISDTWDYYDYLKIGIIIGILVILILKRK